MLRRFVIAALSLLALPITTIAQQPASWIDACGRQWHVDQRGLQYFEVESECLVHRVYYDPVRYEIARQVEGHLAEVGFPAVGQQRVIDRRAFVSPWRPYVTGGYYRFDRSSDMLDNVDWEAAVRNGVRGAVIRGFNGIQAGDPRAEAASEPSPADRLQRLVEQGVEDAVVEGFNSLRVAEQVPLPSMREPDAKPTAETLPAPAAAQEADRVESRSDALKRHLAEAPERLRKANKYNRFETATVGWYVDHDATIRPIDMDDSLAIGYLEAGSQRADLWHEGKSVHEYVLFARYYEDALELKRKHY